MADPGLFPEFQAVARCLREWPDVEVPDRMATPHLRRLVACLRSLRQGEQVGWADIAVLVRGVLRTGLQSPLSQSREETLTVPGSEHPWPDEVQWKLCGVDAELLADGRFRLTARPWKPDWLSEVPETGADGRVASAFHEDGFHRRTSPVPADPFLRATFPHSETDFSTYTSDSHRQAVRTVMACRPGATVLVNLPTGAGKSTVALAPAFARGAPLGVSLVIVPTVALALDQERRVRELVSDEDRNFAYTHETPDDVRQVIRSDIRSGRQQVLFVSPEAVTRSLVPALFAAARAGHLRYFIVDEAHLVDQWGTEFRPEFQAMAGLRRELLRAQIKNGQEGFRTLLMTATLPPTSVDLLLHLFGDPGPVETAIGNLLRPEPTYSVAKFDGWEARRDGVIEALRHLPRPVIVYVTQPGFAEYRFDEFRAAGFWRLGLFTGETPDQERRRVLRAFRNDELDLVVATSAFGLGVDQADVRAIVHACIPESIDRYYQEVGRAGRDGRASLSLVCWTEGDRKEAHSLAHAKLIRHEKGLERWRAMFGAAEQLGPGRYGLKVSARRLAIDSDSDENQKWNIRTLGLFVRAGLLRMSWDVPQIHERDWRDQRESASDEFEPHERDRRLVIELAHGMIDETIWQEIVEPVRLAHREANESAHNLMLQALRPGAEICRLISESYDLGRSQLPAGKHHGRPALVCGGCPAHPSGRVAGLAPLVPPVRSPLEVDISGLSRLLIGRRVALISYRKPQFGRDRRELQERLAEAFRRLLPNGIRIVIAPKEFLESKPIWDVISGLHQVVPDRMLFLEYCEDLKELQVEDQPALPTAVVVRPDRPIPLEWIEVVEGDAPRVLIVPADIQDPTRPDRMLIDMRPPVPSLERFVGRS